MKKLYIMKRNEHTGFKPLVWKSTTIQNKNFFNDVEFVLLSNFLTHQEIQVTFMINLKIKMKSRFSKWKHFDIPYYDIEKNCGLNKNSVRKILKGLKEKRILLMVKQKQWKWDLPGISFKLSPEPEKTFVATKINPGPMVFNGNLMSNEEFSELITIYK